MPSKRISTAGDESDPPDYHRGVAGFSDLDEMTDSYATTRHFLRQEEGPGAPRQLEIGARCIIGRAEACDLKLEGDQISQKHLLVVCDFNRCRVYDLNSRVGFRHQGQEVHEASISHGDRIGIGPYEFIYRRGFETRRKGMSVE